MPIEFTLISQEEVIECSPTMKEAIELAKESLNEHGNKEVENPPKPAIYPQEKAFIHAMPAWLKKKKICGMKWVSGYANNFQKKLPCVVGTIVMNDVETGLPIAFLDGTYITAQRTAAVSGVAMRFLARKDSQVVSIVGTGVQGKFNTLAAKLELPKFKRVQIYDNYAPSLDGYKAEISKIFPDLEIVACSSVEEAVKGSDVIIGCAAGLGGEHRLYQKEFVKPGALILPIHSGGWFKEAAISYKLYADDWAQFYDHEKDVYDLPKAPFAEIGEVVAGKKKGRESDDETIINFNMGLAIHDMIFADYVLKKAGQLGKGKKLTLAENPASPLPALE